MKKNRMKIVASIFSAALLVAAGSVISQRSDVTEVNAVTEASVASIPVTNQVNVVNTSTTARLSFDQLKQKALSIIPGTVVKYEYDYEDGVQIVEFEIRDNNGRKRDLDLVTSNGRVWDIDYDIDANGNRFINQSLFTVNKTFEQCQQVAAAQIQGGQVIAHKQDADKGKFIYEFIVKGSNGLFYEVDVETENGTVTKVELEDDFDFYKYTQVSSTQQTTVQQPVQTPQVQQVASTNNGLETAKNVVLKKFPGATFLKIKQDWDDGVMEYEFTIKTKDGIVYDVEVVNNWIKDID
ncbi:Peptidase propeptide and YPEB domain protein [Candidatus Arthromitus sp. SFB-mouse-SU]|uniref:PepSY domain-containing protein n=1 Tax=unclassified Candidatus Neoarthromitus TaxID=2638829 RepID=UPI000254E298|nr:MULTISPECIES: PepSY domain-containing protein [unclassified Candidatus Arthromitus]AID45118.1 Hypothetical protein SFBmNL_01214 [Candidatus Arthromitus sp. SFB-mouse-NL]EIA25087.1 hypothetical protein SFB1_011G2 [Candidatus Arthromitus sp. SFB-1]EIA29266.1 PepSY domain protein [Candidatus Arthromitus sp. SFB-co]EIA29928.1 Peptidase propeptide and YPEB domain protein [Candidatus Arthromitus sp. SFB-mouse-SU]